MEELGCARVVVCIDRSIEQPSRKGLMRDLGWVGFELQRLISVSGADDIVSDKWIFMAVDV